MPKEIARQIERRVQQLNPFRALMNVQEIGSNDFRMLVSMGDAGAGWVGEEGTRSGTASTSLRERVPSMGELYAYPTASNWAPDDIFFDVQGWLVEEIAAQFASGEATAIISGDGSDTPTGF